MYVQNWLPRQLALQAYSILASQHEKKPEIYANFPV